MKQLTKDEIETIQGRTLAQIYDYKLRAELKKVFSMAAARSESHEDTDFARFMQDTRKAVGLNQDELAAKLQVSAFYVHQIERGNRLPSEKSEIASWLKALGEVRKFSQACKLYDKARK